MNIHICTPVTASTYAEFLSNLENVQKISEYVELRVDAISDFTEKNIEELKTKSTKNIIFTCRSKNEGGSFAGTEKERIAILQKAIDTGFDYVDIELATIKEHKFNRNGKTKIIVSHHDFQETPKYWKLTAVMNEMAKHRPDVVKIATTVKSDDDNQTLFRLLVDRPGEEEWIIIGMGEKGKITRIMAPILGSMLTFASTQYGSSAPGQIDIDEMKSMYKRLGY